MTPIFLDTVGLIGLWNLTDQWHAVATAAFKNLTARRVPMVTTTYILNECGNEASRRSYRIEVVALRRLLMATGRLIDPTPADLAAAWAEYAAGPVGAAGAVDCVSFAVMRRLGLADVLTNDRHFRTAGLNPLF